MLVDNPQPYSAVAGTPLQWQRQDGTEVLMGVEERISTMNTVGAEITPVYGNSVNPRWLSGFIRRRGYSIPEHNAARWLLLMLGDRVDVIESKIARHPLRTVALLAGAFYFWNRRRD
ncbi:MAG: hypothetical protein SF187_08195 [Deltaproteobacteria bacterium]|nr:hypothetical protein [Deltaproteobacteria bacterium]